MSDNQYSVFVMPAIASLASSQTIRFLIPDLALVLLTGVPIAYAEIEAKGVWLKVQAVESALQATVLVQRDQAPQGSRKIKGRCELALEQGVTLTKPNGKAVLQPFRGDGGLPARRRGKRARNVPGPIARALGKQRWMCSTARSDHGQAQL